jgi:hypothetical protein
MSEQEQRRRIPTSDELERTGALIPASAARRSERRGGLFKFFRASRFRVSDDVAANKHVGSQHAGTSPVTSAPSISNRPTESHALASAASGEFAAPVVPSPRPSPQALVPRTIRMDPAVKERRGRGPSDRKGRSGL